ncbi:hypothetical protein BDV98DRAFT_506257 [Pterulicium gracile]|uniref:FAD-binding domain-containing protein n=1 Tax=Pterulicium gracile TaxID=1884261 RepID=A0A5C3QJD7_9AGAR|nr:hypothetical protein BDV98DRAFT_506257 [Pterula gracilis]
MLRTLGNGSARRAGSQLFYARCRQRYASSTTVSQEPEHRDIVIVGGGPVGLALTSALRSSKAVSDALSIELIEASPLSKVSEWNPGPDAFSNRAVSLTNASVEFLRDIGAWEHVDEARTCAVEDMQVWDGLSDARIAFSAPEHLSAPQMSRMTENLNLQRACLRHLAASPSPSVKLSENTKVASVVQEGESEDGWPLVHLSDGRVLRARLLIGADGPNSPVRAYARIPCYGHAYATSGIVATLFHAPPHPLSANAHNSTAFQRFLTTGPIAFLPLQGGSSPQVPGSYGRPTTSSLVWSTTPELAKALIGSGEEVLSLMVNAAFRMPDVSLRYLNDIILSAHRSGTTISPEALREEIGFRERAHGVPGHASMLLEGSETMGMGMPSEGEDLLPPLVHGIQKGTPASFPLRYNHAEVYLGGEKGRGRTALVGDAAHSVHPLAGQGLNLGLADVRELVRCVEAAVRVGGDVGSLPALEAYPRARYLANHTVMSTCDKLHKLYTHGSALSPVVWARSVGLEVVNEMDTLKAGMMGAAGGRPEDALRAGLGAKTNWDLAVKALGAVGGAVQAAKIVRGVVGGVVGRATGRAP